MISNGSSIRKNPKITKENVQIPKNYILFLILTATREAHLYLLLILEWKKILENHSFLNINGFETMKKSMSYRIVHNTIQSAHFSIFTFYQVHHMDDSTRPMNTQCINSQFTETNHYTGTGAVTYWYTSQHPHFVLDFYWFFNKLRNGIFFSNESHP